MPSDTLNLTPRQVRLRATWLLLPPFLFLARPSSGFLLAGVALALPGLALRGWAAANIHKDRTLAVGGPYAHLRHPLYAGSFLVGSGLAVAGGRWFFLPLFIALFLLVYRRTLRGEEAEVEARFGAEYREYRDGTPAFLPRIRPAGRPGGGKEGSAAAGGGGWPTRAGSSGGEDGTEWRDRGGVAPGLPLYLRNKEWQSAVGTGVGFALLWIRMHLSG